MRVELTILRLTVARLNQLGHGVVTNDEFLNSSFLLIVMRKKTLLEIILTSIGVTSCVTSLPLDNITLFRKMAFLVQVFIITPKKSLGKVKSKNYN